MVFCLPFPPVKEGDGAVTNDVGARARQRRERAGGGQRCQIKFFENRQKELKNCQICRQSFFSPNLAIKFPFFAISTYYFTKQKWAKAKNRQMAIFAIEIPMVATEAQKSPKWQKIAKSGNTARNSFSLWAHCFFLSSSPTPSFFLGLPPPSPPSLFSTLPHISGPFLSNVSFTCPFTFPFPFPLLDSSYFPYIFPTMHHLFLFTYTPGPFPSQCLFCL
jgi:hypothetical protein